MIEFARYASRIAWNVPLHPYAKYAKTAISLTTPATAHPVVPDVIFADPTLNASLARTVNI